MASKRITLAKGERQLIKEAIDELLLTVNNHCNPDYQNYSPTAYGEEIMRRERLKVLRRKFIR